MTAIIDLSSFDLSALVDRLAGPAGLKLSLALLHFLWQGVLIAALAAVLMRVLGRRSANRRYAIGVAGMALMAVAPVATFCVVEPPEESPGFAASENLMAEVDRLEGLIASIEGGSWEAGETGDGGTVAAPPLTWGECVRLVQPYALLVWLAGTGLFALRLGFGVRASRRFGRGRRLLPEAWARIAAAVAARVGLKAPRIFLSDNVAEAVAVGLLRPMVLIPAAWLGRIPPEVLEAVLAHELAHLRRYDLWVNLLQRCVEAALFYHPAVWWLSRRVRVEREYCCDETAALAVTGRAAYARALEFVATEAVEARRRAARRPAGWSPALAAGMGGEPMALLQRVRRVLGAEGGPPRGNWMSEGLLALAVPAALWAGIATVGPAVASADEKEEVEVEEEDSPAAVSAPEYADRPSAGGRPQQLTEFVETREVDGKRIDIYRTEDGRTVAEDAGDVLIERFPAEEGDGDVLILRDGEEGPFEVRLDTNGVPMLKDMPIVGRLFETTDLDIPLRGDVIIARSDDAKEAEEDDEESGAEDDLREALRELRAEMKALRGEVEELRSGKENAASVGIRRKGPPVGAEGLAEEYQKAIRARDEAAEAAANEKAVGLANSHKRLVEAQRRLDEVRREVERRSPKPPGPMRLEEHIDRAGGTRMFLHKPSPDGKGPERFEVRVFREKGEGEKGELGPGPEKVIRRLRVEHEDGKPRVFLFREGKDGKPEKVEGRVEGDESVIEFEDGRIHVRPLPEDYVPGSRRDTAAELNIDGKRVPVVVEEEFDGPPDGKRKEVRVRVLGPAPPGADVRPHPGAPRDGRDEVIRKLEEEVRRLRERLEEGRGEAGEARDEVERGDVGPQLADLRTEEARLKETLGDGHPKVQALRRRIEVLEAQRGGKPSMPPAAHGDTASGSDVDVRYAKKALEMAELVFRKSLEANRKTPGAIPDIEVERLRIAVELAELQVERAILGLRADSPRDETTRKPKEELERLRKALEATEAAQRTETVAREAAEAERRRQAAEDRAEEAADAAAEDGEERKGKAEDGEERKGKAEDKAEGEAAGEGASEEVEMEGAAEARTLDALFAKRAGQAFDVIRGGLKGLGLLGPQPITGEVMATKVSDTGRTESVEVSVGSNKGLKKGDEFFLYRGADYLGKVQVTDVLKDRAVGRMIQRVRRAEVRPGDAVTSRL